MNFDLSPVWAWMTDQARIVGGFARWEPGPTSTSAPSGSVWRQLRTASGMNWKTSEVETPPPRTPACALWLADANLYLKASKKKTCKPLHKEHVMEGDCSHFFAASSSGCCSFLDDSWSMTKSDDGQISNVNSGAAENGMQTNVFLYVDFLYDFALRIWQRDE